MLKCACVILNYNDAETTAALVGRVRDYASIQKVIVVDNASPDGSYERLKALADDRVEVLQTGRNGGYGSGNNFGVRHAWEALGAKYALIANPDVVFGDDTLARLMALMAEHPDCAAITPVQLDREGRPIADKAWRIPTLFEYAMMDTRLFSGRIRRSNGYPPEYFQGEVTAVECIPGAFLMVDAEKFLDAGGYDENMFLYCEESMLAWRLKQKGYATLLANDLTYLHYHAVSVSKSIRSALRQYRLIVKSRLYFMKNCLGAGPVRLAGIRLIYEGVILRRRLRGGLK